MQKLEHVLSFAAHEFGINLTDQQVHWGVWGGAGIAGIMVFRSVLNFIKGLTSTSGDDEMINKIAKSLGTLNSTK